MLVTVVAVVGVCRMTRSRTAAQPNHVHVSLGSSGDRRPRSSRRRRLRSSTSSMLTAITVHGASLDDIVAVTPPPRPQPEQRPEETAQPMDADDLIEEVAGDDIQEALLADQDLTPDTTPESVPGSPPSQLPPHLLASPEHHEGGLPAHVDRSQYGSPLEQAKEVIWSKSNMPVLQFTGKWEAFQKYLQEVDDAHDREPPSMPQFIERWYVFSALARLNWSK